MKDTVRPRVVPFMAQFEGVIPWMYLDVRGLVTTAIGDLIDSIGAALSCPWKNSDGTPASSQDIAAEWQLVKGHVGMALWGGGSFKTVTKLRLTPDGIVAVVAKRLDSMDRILNSRYANWEQLPDDAQLAVLSMAWAAGPAFKAPKFDAALASGNWATYATDVHGDKVLVGGCAYECHLDDSQNPGLRPRNAANKALFLSLDAQNNQPATQVLDGPIANESGISDTKEGNLV